MKAHQLRTILEHVPDDLEIRLYVAGPAVRSCAHVHNVVRHGRRGEHHGSLDLHGLFPVWAPCSDADDFELHGQFRRCDELARRLDPDPDVPLGQVAS